MKLLLTACIGLALNTIAQADNSTLDAAIGGGLGGAAGAAIGNELGGRDGAIIGGALGGAAGAAITTDDGGSKEPVSRRPAPASTYRRYNDHPYRHCPPGQAKKGRC